MKNSSVKAYISKRKIERYQEERVKKQKKKEEMGDAYVSDPEKAMSSSDEEPQML